MEKLRIDKKRIAAIVAIAGFVAAIAVLSVVWGKPMVSFVADAQVFRLWVDSHGIWGRLVFLLLLVVQMIVAFIPGEPFEIAAGYAFGWLEGTVLCLAGSLIGSVIVFSAVRTVGKKLLYVFFTSREIDRVSLLNNSKRFNSLIFAVFLIPGTPKDIMSYFVGLSKMKLGQWLFISTIAKIPSIITSTVGGSLVGQAEYTAATLVFAITALVSLLGMYVYNKITEV